MDTTLVETILILLCGLPGAFLLALWILYSWQKADLEAAQQRVSELEEELWKIKGDPWRNFK